MSEQNGATPPEPTFKFNVSRKWGKRWTALMREATELQAENLSLADETDADVAEDDRVRQRDLMRDVSSRIGRLEAIGAEQEQLIAQVLVDVPREWLDDEAPEDIDWHDPESLDWLLENRYSALVQALNTARSANLGN